MAHAPDVSDHCRYLIGSELSAAHGRHGGAILFGLRYAGGDYLRDRRVAGIAPQPMGRREIRTQWCAFRVRAVTTRAGCATDWTAIDAITQRDHAPRRACRNGKARDRGGRGGCGAGIGMRTLRRLRAIGADVSRGCRCTGAGRVARSGRPGVQPASISDAVNPSAHIVGDEKRSIGSNRQVLVNDL